MTWNDAIVLTLIKVDTGNVAFVNIINQYFNVKFAPAVDLQTLLEFKTVGNVNSLPKISNFGEFLFS